MPLDIDLSQAVFGGNADLVIDTAVGCPTCHGDGCARAPRRPAPVMCNGAGEIQQVQRSVLGQVDDPPPPDLARVSAPSSPTPPNAPATAASVIAAP